MIYPLVRELAEGGIPVTVTCRVLTMGQAGVLPVVGRPCERGSDASSPPSERPR